MKSLQWLQNVGCLKNRGTNWWPLTSCTFFCLNAPRRCTPNPPPEPEIGLATAPLESLLIRVGFSAVAVSAVSSLWSAMLVASMQPQHVVADCDDRFAAADAAVTARWLLYDPTTTGRGQRNSTACHPFGHWPALCRVHHKWVDSRQELCARAMDSVSACFTLLHAIGADCLSFSVLT